MSSKRGYVVTTEVVVTARNVQEAVQVAHDALYEGGLDAVAPDFVVECEDDDNEFLATCHDGVVTLTWNTGERKGTQLTGQAALWAEEKVA